MIPNKHIENILPYVPGKPIEEVKRELGLKSVVKLASNENNRGIPEVVVKKLEKKIADLFLYPDGSLYELRKILALKYAVTESQLVFGNGSDEILQLLALAYLSAEKEVLISEGTFSEYEFCARLVNASFLKVPLKDFTYDLQAFAQAVTAKTAVIFLCNPNNPTGTYFSQQELVSFLDSISSDILVVIDEAYYEYAVGDDYPESLSLLSKYKNIIILRTFSKIWTLAGLRIGYSLSSEEIAKSLNKARQPFNVNRFAEVAALAMLEEKGWVEAVLKDINAEKEYFYKEFEKLGLKYLPSKTNFIFLFLPIPAKQAFEALLKKGIIVRPMNGFGYPDSIRVTIGLREENRLFIAQLSEILENNNE